MNSKLTIKIKSLPIGPGVYLYKDKIGEIIYVGKAVVLRKRVQQYFTNRVTDRKTLALVAEIMDVETISVETELDALFLESELVKRYMPRYNILLRDDKSATYIKFSKHRFPVVSLVHLPADDGGQYFGPYFNAYPIRQALRYLRWVFPYLIKPYSDKDSRLDQSIGLSPKLVTKSDERDYLANLNQIKRYINGQRPQVIQDLKKAMQSAAEVQDFEAAAKIRNQIYNLKALAQRIRIKDDSFDLGSQDEVLLSLKELFRFDRDIKRIEGFDISHISGTNVVASMVVFTAGVADRSKYRKFKIKVDQNNDFYNMAETIKRRLTAVNLRKWGVPDLMLIDGGKGQLTSALEIRNQLGLSIPMIGLAKRDEELIIKKNSGLNINGRVLREQNGLSFSELEFLTIKLPEANNSIKLFRRIRDEAHRFAVNYHSLLRLKQQTDSDLDHIRGIGEQTKMKLLKKFKTVSAIKKLALADLAVVVGPAKAQIIFDRYRQQIDNQSK